MGQERPITAEAQLIGTPSPGTDTVFSLIYQIITAIGGGGGAASVSNIFTPPSVDATYRVITGPLSANPVQKLAPTADEEITLRVFLNAMQSGDTVDIGVEVEAVSASSVFYRQNYSYTGVQTGQQYADFKFSIFNGFSGRVTMRQTAGVARAYPYSFE